jgi:hypothetical protein
MTALANAAIYFGSFLAIGIAALWLLKHRLGHDIDIGRVEEQLEPQRGRHRKFLLGAWRDEGSNS